jgi:phenylpropionate dioxygenase-like ring-hydroxylating dioxygenase large terminal subunit
VAIADDYMILTRVGPGTPMGSLLRRYWIPAVMSEQLPERGGAPVRTRLLGENLVAFRDPRGAVGLLGEFCPHRGASLAYALNEGGGLRCLYHGWKINASGAIVDTPAEPPESTFAKKLCHTNYPVHEAGGIVWTYMGPREKQPAFPRFPWLDLPASHLLVVKMFQECNYLQGLEGDIDPAHPNYLHRDLDAADDASWKGAGWRSINQLMHDGTPKIYVEETPYLMRVGAVRRTADPQLNYVRVFESCAPFYSYVAAGPHESRLFKAWQPIDDVSCYTFYVHFDPDRRLDPEAIYRNWGHRTAPPDYRTPYNNANMHLQSRAANRRNVSGIEGAAIQDLAMQESMGPVYDRRQEHLGFSDRAVIFYRRLMLRLINDNEAGKPLPGLDPSLDFQQRGASITLPAGRPWQEALACQEEHERAHPIAVPA